MRRLAWALVLIAGCYEPPPNACGIQCTTSCPDGFSCNGGVCRPSDGSQCTGPTIEWTELGVGARHACGRDTDGAVYCWGENDWNQLGLGPGAPANAGVPTKVGDGFSVIAVGANHTCGIQGGKVLCWGRNDDGQALGGAGGPVQSPQPVPMAAGAPVFTKIAAGARHSCAIGGGQLWCWGATQSLGNGSVDVSSGTRIGALDDWQEVALGSRHGCGISKSQGILCWGINDDHQVDATADSPVDMPRPVTLPNGLHPVRVFAGDDISCAIGSTQDGATEGALYCWGRNARDVPAPGFNNLDTPTQIGTDTTWSDFSVSVLVACGVRGGTAVCWGTEESGGLGDGFWFAFDMQVTNAVALGAADEIHTSHSPWIPDFDRADFTCMRSGGTISCTGDNSNGELGIGTPSWHPTPVVVQPPLSGAKWTAIAAGRHHACATIDDGSVWCWGADLRGQVSAGVARGLDEPCLPDLPCDFPRPVAAPSGITGADQIIAGFDYTCTRKDAAIHCWGSRDEGVLGVANPTGHNVTTVAPPSGSWTGLYGGDRASCGVTANGIACWGHLVGTVSETPVAVTDPAIHDPREMRFGDDVLCVTRDDSARVCLGNNDRGQLGDGTTTPDGTGGVQESGITIATFTGHHGCEIKDGNVYCWGDNSQGEAGASNTPQGYVTMPTLVTAGTKALAGCTAVGVGYYQSCAICDPDATAYCWGDNSFGGLGRGMISDFDEQAAPVAIPPGHPLAHLAVGNDFGCAIDQGGQLFCWGDGGHGEVGDGSQSRNLMTPTAR